ncbi:hypothetical protein [Streptomyces sp. NPDC046862]|uniref:hypothetical protein n=1 Tax=Streptomyces sp. NPDC046862 TaxID=3154603 RepID=UPI00345708A2
MAHAHAQATPVSGTPKTAPRAPLPDVFSARTHTIALWTLTVLSGLVYGYWAAAVDRDGGPITGWNIFFGFMSALAFMLVLTAVRMVTPWLPREPHAALWASFAGIAFGFLYSLTDASIERSSLLSLPVAALVGVMTYYWYYTHEDAAGHRVR